MYKNVQFFSTAQLNTVLIFNKAKEHNAECHYKLTLPYFYSSSCTVHFFFYNMHALSYITVKGNEKRFSTNTNTETDNTRLYSGHRQ